jgi:hypothetical protein
MRNATGLLLLVGALAGSAAVHAMDWGVITPTELKWTDIPSYPGAQFALISGDPSKPGPLTLRARFPPNYQLGPHTHTDDRVLTILEGSWRQGIGEDFDPATAALMPAGSVVLIPADQVHFDISGPEGATVQVTGTGGSRTHYLAPAYDPKTRYGK